MALSHQHDLFDVHDGGAQLAAGPAPAAPAVPPSPWAPAPRLPAEWPGEPPAAPAIVFDDLPCPDDTPLSSWEKLPRALRAAISSARAAQERKLSRLAGAAGAERARAQTLLPFCERGGEPLQVEPSPPGTSGAPKRLLQLPLFAVRARGTRPRYDDAVISGPDGFSVRFRGEVLDQIDLTCYMAVLNLYRARRRRDDPGVSLSYYMLLRELRQSPCQNNRARLRERLRRLSEASLVISLGSRRFSGSLLNLSENGPDGRLWVQPGKAFQPFFVGPEWQRLEWNVRLELGRDQLALALWSYFRTFAHPFPVRVETLRERVGSEVTKLEAFRYQTRAAMENIDRALAVCSGTRLQWEIDTSDRLCVEWKR